MLTFFATDTPKSNKARCRRIKHGATVFQITDKVHLKQEMGFFGDLRHRTVPMPISANATITGCTVAETTAIVLTFIIGKQCCELTIVAHGKCLCIGVADTYISVK